MGGDPDYKPESEELEGDPDYKPASEVEEEEIGGDEEMLDEVELQGIRRRPWSAEDTAVLEVAFQQILRKDAWPPRKPVKKIFVTNRKAKAIWTREDCDEYRERCLDKVKNIFRARRAKRLKKQKKITIKKEK